MTNQDYDQKKRERFVQFCKDNGIDQEVNISIFDAFDQIFDRAYAFGKKIGNSDFSDAEEEEILTVPRKDIVELFQEVQKTISQCKGTALAVQSVGIKDVLWSFFGSKCLPDNVATLAPNVDSLSQNPTENCDNESHISADCDKPAEPTDFGKEVNFPTKKQSRNFSQETANCDNRLQIAAMAMQGILSNENAIQYAINNFRLQDGSRNRYQAVAECSLAFADALIAKVEKGAER